VQDQTGAVLAGATVELVDASGVVVRTVDADAAGAFRFDAVRAGQYELRARFAGFKAASARVRVGARAPSAQRLVLGVADLRQEITVKAGAPEVDASASANVDAVAVDTAMLESLPVFDNDYAEAHTVTVSLDAFNALNRVNYGTYVGTVGSPLFGRPVTARAPRQLQLSARVKF
jgi:hypothetical protein